MEANKDGERCCAFKLENEFPAFNKVDLCTNKKTLRTHPGGTDARECRICNCQVSSFFNIRQKKSIRPHPVRGEAGRAEGEGEGVCCFSRRIS